MEPYTSSVDTCTNRDTPASSAACSSTWVPTTLVEHEVGRAGDRAVHVRLGREVHHHVGAGHHLGHGDGVADVAAHEAQPRFGGRIGQVGQRAGVGEQVEHDHLGIAERRVPPAQQRAHVVRPDEPGSAGDENPHEKPLRARLFQTRGRNDLAMSITYSP